MPSAYSTTEIVREYDGFSDWPDKPTHLAVLNALMGIAYVHTDYGSAANPMTPGTLKTVRTNVAGGTTTHYVVRTVRLPLTQPLRDAGLNTSLLDALLRPQIDRAYVRRPQVAPREPASRPSIVALAAKDLGRANPLPRQSADTSISKQDKEKAPKPKRGFGFRKSRSGGESRR